MIVREAQTADATAVTALLGQLGYSADVGRVAARLGEFDWESRSLILVAEDGDELIGLASATLIPLFHEDGSWCRISALVVAESERRRGVGRRLVTEIEERARDSGCRYLEVTSAERPERGAAHAFYEALGLEQVSRRYLKAL